MIRSIMTQPCCVRLMATLVLLIAAWTVLGEEPQTIVPPGANAGKTPVPEMVGQPFMTLKGHFATLFAVAFSPDGKFLVSGSARLYSEVKPDKPIGNGDITLWNAVTGEVLRTFQAPPDLERSR